MKKEHFCKGQGYARKLIVEIVSDAFADGHEIIVMDPGSNKKLVYILEKIGFEYDRETREYYLEPEKFKAYKINAEITAERRGDASQERGEETGLDEESEQLSDRDIIGEAFENAEVHGAGSRLLVLDVDDTIMGRDEKLPEDIAKKFCRILETTDILIHTG